MKNAPRYTLIRDNDLHWYVCPADRVDEAHRIFDAINEYWSALEPQGECPDDPDFVQPVGGSPTLVTFADPIIG